MCGIVGFIGREQAAPILLEGLSRLEYRGYDSAGLAVYDREKGLQVVKAKGRLQVLRDLTDGGAKVPGTMGLGHTRWATHGAPNDENAHPQVSQSGRIAVVHNGIIENYGELKSFLEAKGVVFTSETDTEVVAQLLEFPSCWNSTTLGICWTRSLRCSTASRGPTPWGSSAPTSRINSSPCGRTPP